MKPQTLTMSREDQKVRLEAYLEGLVKDGWLVRKLGTSTKKWLYSVR